MAEEIIQLEQLKDLVRTPEEAKRILSELSRKAIRLCRFPLCEEVHRSPEAETGNIPVYCLAHDRKKSFLAKTYLEDLVSGKIRKEESTPELERQKRGKIEQLLPVFLEELPDWLFIALDLEDEKKRDAKIQRTKDESRIAIGEANQKQLEEKLRADQAESVREAAEQQAKASQEAARLADEQRNAIEKDMAELVLSTQEQLQGKDEIVAALLKNMKESVQEQLETKDKEVQKKLDQKEQETKRVVDEAFLAKEMAQEAAKRAQELAKEAQKEQEITTQKAEIRVQIAENQAIQVNSALDSAQKRIDTLIKDARLERETLRTDHTQEIKKLQDAFDEEREKLRVEIQRMTDQRDAAIKNLTEFSMKVFQQQQQQKPISD